MGVLTFKSTSFMLSEEDKRRLERFAPLFGFEFQRIDESQYFLRSITADSSVEGLLPVAVAHRRLLAEIASKASRWVYFNTFTSTRDSLLGLPDAKIERIAELYAHWLADESLPAAAAKRRRKASASEGAEA